MSFQRIEFCVPKGFKIVGPIPYLFQGRRTQSINPLPTGSLLRNQFRAFENSQMLRNRGKRNAKGFRQPTSREVTVSEPHENGAAGRMRNGVENVILEDGSHFRLSTPDK